MVRKEPYYYLGRGKMTDFIFVRNLWIKRYESEVEQSIFDFKDQQDGTGTGIPLSPFLKNVFMSKYETEIKT